MADADFRRHWREVHGEIAARLPGLHSYRQNHIVERLFERSPFPGHAIDGISQLAFDDIAAMEVAELSPEYGEAKRDIPRFQGEITILVLAEDSAAGVPTVSSAKLLVLSMHRQEGVGMTVAQRASDCVVARVSSPTRAVLNRVVDRSHPVEAGVPQGDLPIERMDEFCFTDRDSLRQWVASDLGQMRMFADPLYQPLAIYVVNEVVLV